MEHLNAERELKSVLEGRFGWYETKFSPMPPHADNNNNISWKLREHRCHYV